MLIQVFFFVWECMGLYVWSCNLYKDNLEMLVVKMLGLILMIYKSVLAVSTPLFSHI